jgi:hypothetical protein
MKSFKCIMVVRQPRALVWTTVRDRLPELVPYMRDVAAIVTDSRVEPARGVVRLVNRWTARAPIPAALVSVIKPEMLGWTDYAEWREADGECSWRIEPRFFTERIRCSGVARYEPAMAGRGTRVTFEGALAIAAGGGFLAGSVSAAIESFVTSLIPRNAQHLYRAVDSFLGRAPADA